MRNKTTAAVMAFLMALTALAGQEALAPSPVSAAGPYWADASWGVAGANWVDSGSEWRGFVRDIRTDGGCVSLWTFSDTSWKVRRIARSCGGEVWGTAKYGNRYQGVRMYHDKGWYRTLKWPG